MRAHLALSHSQQGLVTLQSTGPVLPRKDRLHTRHVTAVLKGQRIQWHLLPESSFPPACTQAQSLPRGSWSSIRHFRSDLWEQSVPSVLRFPGTAASVACHSWKLRLVGCSNGPVPHLPHRGDDTSLYSSCPLNIFTFSRWYTERYHCHITSWHLLYPFPNRIFTVELLQIYRIIVQRVPTYPIHTPISSISDVFH